MERKEHIQALLHQYLDAQEMNDDLLDALQQYQDDMEWSAALQALMDQQPRDPAYQPERWEPLIRNILSQGTGQPELAPVVPLHRNSFFRRLAAAAVLILALGTAVWFYFSRDGEQDMVMNGAPGRQLTNDVPPGSDRAILTLANGRQIVLDSSSGNLVTEGGVTVINLAGQLSYEEANGLPPDSYQDNVSPFTTHTVSTPRGGQYQLVLADGTKVWLNAASSLRFPTAFTGKDRVVELTGEGYFEVVHNSRKPFHVRVNGMEVQVLGTHFNINSYEDEDAIRTTLLEGSVKVTVADSRPTIDDSRILRPGEQATLTDDSRLTVVESVDLEAVMAWKNGLFQLKDADIHYIMRQVERWYDVEVVYEGQVNQRFNGTIPRNVSVATLLRVLELTGGVRFSVDGKKITIKP